MSLSYASQLYGEVQDWDNKFRNEIEKFDKGKQYSSYRRQIYYSDMKKYFFSLLSNKKINSISILEVGSGSGKASLNLQPRSITLVDASKNALDFAALINDTRYQIDDVTYVNMDFLSLDINKTYDLVFNIGTLEHYSDEVIITMIKKMFALTDLGGYMVFGLPNKYSGPILKARFLSTKIGSFFSGYRLDSERFFSDKEVYGLISKAFQLDGSSYSSEVNIGYVGSFAPMESRRCIVNILNISLFKKQSFLKLYSIKKVKNGSNK